jgi:hypothetical protein
MSIVIAIALVAILGALASAGVFMLRRPREDEAPEGNKRMARALAVRVGVSVALFVFILVAWKLGWIAPKGLPTGR